MTDPQALIYQRLAHYNWGILGNQGYVLGVDLGGYGLRAALLDLQSHRYASLHTDPQGSRPEEVSDAALQLVHRLLDEHSVAPERLVRVGVGFGGPVDPIKGTTRRSPRKSGWENFSLKDYFQDALDAVTLVDNDANLIALGEATFGVGHGYRHLCYLHLSSGVGGGLVLDGRLYHGATATAGEIGHAIINPAPTADERAPTLEEQVSIAGILSRARQAGLDTDNLHDIFSDNAIGQQVVAETTDILARHIAHVVSLIDPQIVVLGGIVVRIGGSSLIEQLKQCLPRYIHPQFMRPVRVEASALDNDSIAIGGLALALTSMQD
jgi:glucokinase